ncbi:hypothetical protein LXA43DRAFT_931447 [Ganoderma leucocontextum]|nr:hypothetical protein LXA43DRAFT_931447 [Ganoderma leucocontextum]
MEPRLRPPFASVCRRPVNPPAITAPSACSFFPLVCLLSWSSHSRNSLPPCNLFSIPRASAQRTPYIFTLRERRFGQPGASRVVLSSDLPLRPDPIAYSLQRSFNVPLHLRLTSTTATSYLSLSSNVERSNPKKGKAAVVRGGLNSEWQDWYSKPAQTRRPTVQVSANVTPARSANAKPPRSLASRAGTPHSTKDSHKTKSHMPESAALSEPTEPGDGLREYAGLQDEDESNERDALDADPDAGALIWRDAENEDGDEQPGKADPAGGVIVPRRKDIYTSIRRVPAAQAAAPAEGKKKAASSSRLSGNDLPRDYRDDFNKRLVPFLRAVSGTMRPFSPLELDEKQQIFKKVFPWSDIQLQPDDVFAVLMDNRYSEWKTKFREAALAVVASEMTVGDRKTSREARVTFCREQLALAPGADRADKSTIKGMRAPFFWEVWGDGGQKQGRFEGQMLVKTFAYAHLPVLEAVPHDLRQVIPEIYGKTVPIGALVMAALALEFALHAWLTGKQYIPQGAEGNFSADNWGDRIIKLNGTTVQENKVQSLFKRAETLDSERIFRILDKARAVVGERRRAVQKGQVAGNVQDDSDPDFASSD